MNEQTNRIKPKLIMTLDTRRVIDNNQLVDALILGHFASIIMYDSENDEANLQKVSERLIEPIQSNGIAFLIANDSRIAGRIQADGIHLEGKVEDLQTALGKRRDSMIVGYGNLRDKHSAMVSGEFEPDYLMFGKLGADKKPEPHPRNILLGTWWAEVMEIPAIVQAGASVETFKQTLDTGADFISVEDVLFNSSTPIEITNQLINIIDENDSIEMERHE